jgi:AraC-like DNA-binding protein
MDLLEITRQAPIVPYVREAEIAARSPWQFPERRLLDYLLVYVQDGRCRFSVDGIDYPLKAGDFCLIQPGECCTLEGLDATITPFAHFDVFYHPRRRESFPTRPGQTDLTPFRSLLQPKLNDLAEIHIPTQFVPSEPEHFASMLKAMIHAWHDPSPLGQLEAQKLGTQLVFSLLQDFGQWRPRVQPSNALDWFESYLSLHLAEPLRIEDMARQGGFSPSRFSAMVRQTFGMPPHQFLTHMRVRHARELLDREDLTLDLIAGYCGFSDVAHFIKTFKQHTGVTPGSLRARKLPPASARMPQR